MARERGRATGPWRPSLGTVALLAIPLLGTVAVVGFRAGQSSQLTASRAEAAKSQERPRVDATKAAQAPSVLQAALSTAVRQQLDTCLGQQESAPAHVPSDDPQNTDPTPADHLRSAEQEGKDFSFSDAHTASLEEDLTEASRRFDFRFEHVDCRSSRCLVKLDWASLADARSAMKSGFSGAFTRSNCHHRMVLPEVVNEAARATTTLIATCAASEAAKAALTPATTEARAQAPL